MSIPGCRWIMLLGLLIAALVSAGCASKEVPAPRRAEILAPTDETSDKPIQEGSDQPERIVEVDEGRTALGEDLEVRIIASGPGPLTDIEDGSALRPNDVSQRWSIRAEIVNDGKVPVRLRRAFDDRALFDAQGHRRPAIPRAGGIFVIDEARDDSGQSQPDLLLPGAKAWAEQSWVVRNDDVKRQLTLNLRLTDSTLFRFDLERTPR